MGCDIHFYVEKYVEGRWRPADRWVTEEADPENGSEACQRVPYHESFYHDRNYDLFAILADVRNGVGFAGVDSGDGFNPIDDPRGLPEDCCDEIRECSESWGMDGHSHSYFTLQELFDYDWTQTVHQRGVVDAKEYIRWCGYARGEGAGPDNYSADVSGPNIRKVDEPTLRKEIDEYVAAHPDQPLYTGLQAFAEANPNLHCTVEWETAYYKCVRHFWSDTIPRLLRVGPPDDVRIVFWFDN